MRACSFLVRCLLALCWISPAAYAILFAGSPEAEVSGVYQGHAPPADAAKRVFTLNLASDGTSSLTTLYIGKDVVTQLGRWTLNGGQVVMTFDAMGPNKPPRPIAFRYRGHGLKPVHWDASEWGRTGPPVFYRAHASPGGV